MCIYPHIDSFHVGCLFLSVFNISKHVPIYFSCLGESCSEALDYKTSPDSHYYGDERIMSEFSFLDELSL